MNDYIFADIMKNTRKNTRKQLTILIVPYRPLSVDPNPPDPREVVDNSDSRSTIST